MWVPMVALKTPNRTQWPRHSHSHSHSLGTTRPCGPKAPAGELWPLPLIWDQHCPSPTLGETGAPHHVDFLEPKGGPASALLSPSCFPGPSEAGDPHPFPGSPPR